MKKFLTLVMLLCVVPFAVAHTPLMSCFNEDDGSVTCEGGFSDGSSASGVKFRVEEGGKTVLETKFDANNEVNFPKPQGAYSAIFDGGEGHVVVIKGTDIH